MQSVVEEGTGYRGAVTGYSIGGKTGTSEPRAGREDIDGYVATYVAISPVEDTQVVLLLNLYKPPKSNHQGGTISRSCCFSNVNRNFTLFRYSFKRGNYR